LLGQPDVDKTNVDYVLLSSRILVITFPVVLGTSFGTLDFLLNLGSRPEYWNDLLDEQEKVNPNHDKVIDLNQVAEMKRLDSFLKETFRVTGTTSKL